MCSACDTKDILKASPCGYPGCLGRPNQRNLNQPVFVKNGLIWAFCEEHLPRVLELGVPPQDIDEALGDRWRFREIRTIEQKPEMTVEAFIELFKS